MTLKKCQDQHRDKSYGCKLTRTKSIKSRYRRESWAVYKSCCLAPSHGCSSQGLAAATRGLLLSKAACQSSLLQHNRNKKDLESQAAKEAETKTFKNMVPELLRFPTDNPRDTITHLQHSQHLNFHVHLQANLMKAIKREFVQWKLTIKAQAQSVEKGKLLLLIIAKHLLKVLESVRVNMTTSEADTLNQSITILTAIFLIKILQAHECKCFACESNVI